MQEIKQFFINIDKGNVDENEQNLVSDGIILAVWIFWISSLINN